MICDILILVFLILVMHLDYKIIKILIDITKEETEGLEEKVNIKKSQRKHTSIATTDYSNQLLGRKAYDDFKNERGLYEPITPTKGVNLDRKGAK